MVLPGNDISATLTNSETSDKEVNVQCLVKPLTVGSSFT